MTMTTASLDVETLKLIVPAGDFYFKHRPDPSLPAEDPGDIELEEYASPT